MIGFNKLFRRCSVSAECQVALHSKHGPMQISSNIFLWLIWDQNENPPNSSWVLASSSLKKNYIQDHKCNWDMKTKPTQHQGRRGPKVFNFNHPTVSLNKSISLKFVAMRHTSRAHCKLICNTCASPVSNVLPLSPAQPSGRATVTDPSLHSFIREVVN